MSAIKFGVGFPTGMEGMMYPVPFCDPENLYQIAREAEDGGFDSIGGNDHIVTQEYVKKSWKSPPRYYEIFETFSYLAAKTETLRFYVECREVFQTRRCGRNFCYQERRSR